MLIVGHTAIGIAIGLGVPQPAAALALGVISHHVADAVPHFDPGSFYVGETRRVRNASEYTARDWVMSVADALLGLAFLLWALVVLPMEYRSSVFWGVVGANLPDIVHNVPFWNKLLRRMGWVRLWQEKIHWVYHHTVPAHQWVLGLGTQVVVITLAIWFVLTVSSQ